MRIGGVILAVLALVLACNKSKSEAPADEPAPRSARPSATVEPEPPTPASNPKPRVAPPQQTFGRGATVVADLGQQTSAAGMTLPLQQLELTRTRIFVTTSAGEIYRMDREGQEAAMAHDSLHGTGPFASTLASDGETLFFVSSGDESSIHWLRADGRTRSVPAGDALVVRYGDGYLYYNRFQAPGIFRLDARAPNPEPEQLSPEGGTTSPIPAGSALYWTNYRRGTITRFDLATRRSKVLTRAKRPIGLAVVGDQVVFGTESDGGIHVVSSKGGKARKVGDGYNNHDVFVANSESVFFYDWDPKGSRVHAYDLEAGRFRLIADQLPDEPRDLAVDGSRLLFVAGPRVLAAPIDADLSAAEQQ